MTESHRWFIVAYVEGDGKEILVARDLIRSIRKLVPGAKVEYAIGDCKGAE
jgi:hypothetical protein